MNAPVTPRQIRNMIWNITTRQISGSAGQSVNDEGTQEQDLHKCRNSERKQSKMSSWKKYKNSRFLTETDVEHEPVVTIVSVTDQNVSSPGEKPKIKPCTKFRELEKPLVTNVTNLKIMAKIIGTDEMDEWPGHKVVLYFDPSVSYGTEVKGGIRVRKPRVTEETLAPVVASETVTAPDAEVPF